MRRVIRVLVERGLRVGVIKHAHHDFDVDHPGKDSYEVRKAGASQMLVSSRQRRALITEVGNAPEPNLEALTAEMDPDLDIILVEGFKHAEIPKLEIRRRGMIAPKLGPSDPHVIAVVTDVSTGNSVTEDLPVLDLNAPVEVATFIVRRFIPALAPRSDK